MNRYSAYGIIKSAGLVTDFPAKPRRRKWVRYERLYLNAMWYTVWRAMKDPRMKGLDPVTCLDDASRRVTGATLFKVSPRRMRWPHSGRPYAGSE